MRDIRLPRNTCPLIDDVIREARELADRTEDGDARDLISLMEEIRSANATLREAAEYYRECAESYLEDKEEAERERDRAMDERDKAIAEARELASHAD